MILINKIQKSIYDCLTIQTSDNFQKLTGIFNYIEKNKNFPYIFISNGEVKNLSTFSKKLYSCFMNINVFDNDSSNSYAINLLEEIKQIFTIINNFNIIGYLIIDIKFSNIEIKLENDGKNWNGKISFEFIVSEY